MSEFETCTFVTFFTEGLYFHSLEHYDKNDDFRGPLVVLPKPITVQWPSTGFQQLKADHKMKIPPICEESINGYFTERLCLDGRSNADSQAISKGRGLLESDRLQACSICFNDDWTYFSAICGAAMKTKVSWCKVLQVIEIKIR